MSYCEKISPTKPYKTFPLEIINEYHQKETKYWAAMNVGPKHPMVLYYDIGTETDEFNLIWNFIKNKAGYFKFLKVTKILRIQNPYLMASFVLARDAMEDCNPQSRFALHGTKASNVGSIARNNFDINIGERHRYGRGVYFTTDIVFASKFCDKKKDKQLIVANVLQGRTCIGQDDMEYPSGDADTSLNVTKKKESIIVKYDEDTFYPAYIVHFNIDY